MTTNTAENSVRSARMRHPSGPSAGASVAGVSYPANADGTVTVPTGEPVAEMLKHGFEVIEVINPISTQPTSTIDRTDP